MLALLPPIHPPGRWDEGRAAVFGFLLLVLAPSPSLLLHKARRSPLLCPLHISAVQPRDVLSPLVLSLPTVSFPEHVPIWV
ncbi:hypothetical protein NDU88_003978 [Pleurodeles waltl]|uniref:Uncharacterized protein n=1 Tax=Pleurodeles waltl TaxID=8319 RepID=A0AAV7WUI7_PLEWA|nr:hypothetical protein NDU88_003978 [Pleurodeles waltl]